MSISTREKQYGESEVPDVEYTISMITRAKLANMIRKAIIVDHELKTLLDEHGFRPNADGTRAMEFAGVLKPIGQVSVTGWRSYSKDAIKEIKANLIKLGDK